MKLQTTIPLQKTSSQINYRSQLLLLGSCFAEHVARKLEYYKFRSMSNPFGILFQPRAIENLLDRALNGKEYKEEELFFLDESWHCYDAHSDLSGSSAENTVDALNQALRSTNHQITQSTHILITLGTAWVYRLKKTSELVANCHKVPQKNFEKELLSPEEVLTSMRNICELIRSVNNNATIIFTVSPVRHLKDGFTENMRSKAHLLTAVHQLTDPLTHYFPSYEIMMDELRDYRFYARDMVHPNEIAVDYIWEKFTSTWIDETAFETMARVDQVQKGLEHRPFNPESEKHRKFIQDLEKKIAALKKEFSFMDFIGS